MAYQILQYWVPSNTYTFGAIAPAEKSAIVTSDVALAGNAISMKVAFTNDDGTLDLLHAAPAPVANVTDGYNTPVAMTFNHQLAKVKFSFENAVGTGYNVKVTDVKIKNAYKTGTLNAGAANTWSKQADPTLVLDFGNAVDDEATENTVAVIGNGEQKESYREKLMIPSNAATEYEVEFTVELLKGDVSLKKDIKHTVKISNVELKFGYCYDFKATLTSANVIDPENPLNLIQFTATVSDWNEGGENPVVFPDNSGN